MQRPEYMSLRIQIRDGILRFWPSKERKYNFSEHVKIFTGLENAFAGPGWVWKPHKSEDHNFLHRNYTPPKKKSRLRFFFSSSFFFSTLKNRRFFGENLKNFESLKIQILEFHFFVSEILQSRKKTKYFSFPIFFIFSRS